MHQGSRAVRLSRDAHEATVAAGMKPRAGGPNKGRWVLRPGHVTASRFGFRQPVSDPRGPVGIAVVANKDGVFCVPSAGPNGLRAAVPVAALAKDLGHLDERRYEHAARAVDETGRVIGGWRKAHEAAQG